MISVIRDAWSWTGLDPQEIDRIFDSFYTTKPDGIGVGLSISRSIIEAHGGQLSASPALPYGARFSFVLPSVKVSPEADSGAVSGIAQPARELAGSAER